MVKLYNGNGKVKAHNNFIYRCCLVIEIKKNLLKHLAHEMIHLWQMNHKGDTGNHNKLFYSFRPKLNRLGLDL